jgi:SecD/SecF fusion protein
MSTASLYSLLAQTTSPAPMSASETGMRQVLSIVILIAVVVIPFVLGSFLAKRLKLPTHGLRLGWALLALFASLAVLAFGQLTYGVDLDGGTILTYELDQNEIRNRSANDASFANPEGNRALMAQIQTTLTDRINPSGTSEIVVRPVGTTQIEVIVPALEAAAVDQVKRSIEEQGILQFAIVANRTDHQDLIERAAKLAATGSKRKEIFNDENKQVGLWATIGRKSAEDNVQGVREFREKASGDVLRNGQTGKLVMPPTTLDGEYALELWTEKEGIKDLQVLLAIDAENVVVGTDLAKTSAQLARDGSGWELSFSLKPGGATKFYTITATNSPDNGFYRRLAIIFGDQVLSAPQINNAISGEGVIQGRFTQQEINFLKATLDGGALPAAISKQPISEFQIGPTLGAAVKDRGLFAVTIAFIAVVLFMVLYYFFFGGFVAVLGVCVNLLITLAVMILIKQPITMSGLAGLVLTVGMAVDANVLIFERIREELAKGAALRMAIRNGFDRAAITIIDSNLTTVLTALVLYVIGTDQVRGFAITLILGLLSSMFTAIHLSRTLFDIAERWNLTQLRMVDYFGAWRDRVTGGRGFDFVGKRYLFIGASIVLIVAGMAATIARGRGLLDTDFNGGSTLTMRLVSSQPVDKVRDAVEQAINVGKESVDRYSLTLTEIKAQGSASGTIFKVDTSVPTVEELKRLVGEGMDKAGLTLVTARATATPVTPSANLQPAAGTRAVIQPVAFRTPQESSAQPPADTATPPADTATPPADTATPPADTATPPADTATPPADTATPPADTATPAGDATQPAVAPSQPPAMNVTQKYKVALTTSGDDGKTTQLTYKAMMAKVIEAGKQAGITVPEGDVELAPVDETSDWTPDSSQDFADWNLGLTLPAGQADTVMNQFVTLMAKEPSWLGSTMIGSRVAKEMQYSAYKAMFFSLIAIVLYVWFRFQKVIFGIAAVVALIHDVLVTVGALALSRWLASFLGFAGIEEFKINLTVVAALLTLVGYSINDTIVLFDRIREVRGKSPRLTVEMVNLSINQTLSRTILTSLTVFIVVLLLYFLGGAEIHAFSFAMVIGVIAGTYSTIYIASPVVLWLLGSKMDTSTPTNAN